MRAASCGGTRVEQAGERHLHEVGVAQQAGAVGEAVFQGLGQQVQVGAASRARPWRGRAAARDRMPERLRDDDAARGGRRHGQHPEAAVVGLDRRALDDGVARAGPRSDSTPPAALTAATISRGDGALVEGVRARDAQPRAGSRPSAGRLTMSPVRSGSLKLNTCRQEGPRSSRCDCGGGAGSVATRSSTWARREEAAKPRAASCSAGRTQAAKGRLPKRLHQLGQAAHLAGHADRQAAAAGAARAPACRPGNTARAGWPRAPARGSRGRSVFFSLARCRRARSRRRRCPRRAG